MQIKKAIKEIAIDNDLSPLQIIEAIEDKKNKIKSEVVNSVEEEVYKNIFWMRDLNCYGDVLYEAYETRPPLNEFSFIDYVRLEKCIAKHRAKLENKCTK